MKPGDWRYQLHRTQYALRRRQLTPQVERVFGELIAQWDQAAVADCFRPFWEPVPEARAAKFLDVDTWLREAAMRYLSIEVDKPGRPLRILDVGSGAGYFLQVCRHHGHEVHGLDLDNEPLYNAMFDYFELPRTIHRIQALEPLPEALTGFDLVTAFMTCFDEYEDEQPWGTDAWSFFLDDLHPRLNPAGRIVIKFNLKARTGEFYSDEVAQLIRESADWETHLFLDFATLSRR